MSPLRTAVRSRLGVSTLILLLALSVFPTVAARPPIHAASTAEISPSNGSATCPAYFTGPGVANTSWNATTSTCTVTARVNVGPTVCIGSTPGGCVGNATDDLVVDAGVKVVLLGAGGGQVAQLCVYSTLENHGTIDGASYCDYGTIINYGTIKIPIGNYFMTLPDNGFGILDNRQGGQIINDYNFIDAGKVVNNGTIYNHGQFGNDNQYHGTFANLGTFVGSAPCFSFAGCRTWVGLYDNVTSSGTVINQLGNGVLLTITGATGTNVVVISQNQTNAAPMGLGSLNISSALFYDVMINGISTGTARLCIANAHVSESMDGGMQYWNGTAWAFAGSQAVNPVQLNTSTLVNATTTTSTSQTFMVCGDIPVVDLVGTPIGTGTPLSASQQTISTSQATTSGNTAHTAVSASGTNPSTSSGNTPTTMGGAPVDYGPYLAAGITLTLLALALGFVLSRRRTGPSKP